MHKFMVQTVVLLYWKHYSKQSEQLEAKCFAEGHAATGIEHRPNKSLNQ